ncbi:hypothetical protein [Streptomyces sp. NPDC054940]
MVEALLAGHRPHDDSVPVLPDHDDRFGQPGLGIDRPDRLARERLRTALAASRRALGLTDLRLGPAA